LSITVTGTSAGAVDAFNTGINAKNYGTDLTIKAYGAVTGGLNAIYGLNKGSGALTITTTGAVDGVDGGIVAKNYGTSLTINAASASSDVSGIAAYNHGSGDLKITATGTVNGSGTGPTDAGILAKNYGGNLKIYGAAVSGGRYGIEALNHGFGELYIKTTGLVTGSGAYGINAANYNSDSSLTVNVASVTGAVTGIGASNVFSNSGVPLSITSTGTVRGGSAYGIAERAGYGGVTIQAANVYGGTTGIFAYAKGGALSITSTGTVTGSGTGGGTQPRLTSGIYALNKYGSALTIKTYGPVTGSQHGIFASFGETDAEGPTGALSITAGGSVKGLTGSGVYAKNFGYPGSSTSITVTQTGFVQGIGRRRHRSFIS
jgi:autotransporter family porin